MQLPAAAATAQVEGPPPTDPKTVTRPALGARAPHWTRLKRAPLWHPLRAADCMFKFDKKLDQRLTIKW